MFQIFHDEINGDLIAVRGDFAPAGHDQIGPLHRGSDELNVCWLDELVVRLQHALHLSAPLDDVSLDAPCQPHVIIGEHKNFKVQKLVVDLAVQQREDAFKNNDRGPLSKMARL